jgi:predicted NBD/HSP70 family sugar kinase
MATMTPAEQVLAETALYIGGDIADLINLISPGRTILGSWAGLLPGERLLPAIRESAGQHSLSFRS